MGTDSQAHHFHGTCYRMTNEWTLQNCISDASKEYFINILLMLDYLLSLRTVSFQNLQIIVKLLSKRQSRGVPVMAQWEQSD